MNTDEQNEHEYQVIGSAYAVSNSLGCGFLEKVYERAMIIELRERGAHVDPQAKFPVFYRNQHVGTYAADLLVNKTIIVELKCVDSFAEEHIAQCLNYLRASKLRIALLINFQKPKLEWRRVVL